MGFAAPDHFGLKGVALVLLVSEERNVLQTVVAENLGGKRGRRRSSLSFAPLRGAQRTGTRKPGSPHRD